MLRSRVHARGFGWCCFGSGSWLFWHFRRRRERRLCSFGGYGALQGKIAVTRALHHSAGTVFVYEMEAKFEAKKAGKVKEKEEATPVLVHRLYRLASGVSRLDDRLAGWRRLFRHGSLRCSLSLLVKVLSLQILSLSRTVNFATARTTATWQNGDGAFAASGQVPARPCAAG